MAHRSRPGIAVITVSSSRSDLNDDQSGMVIETVLRKKYHDCRLTRCLTTDRVRTIAALLRKRIVAGDRLIITTGGTGLTPDDVTPEATRTVIDREIPGIIMALIVPFLAKIPSAALSRAVAGIAGQSLIVNLPGSPRACSQQMEILLPLLEHALDKIAGDRTPCGGRKFRIPAISGTGASVRGGTRHV